MPVTPKKKNEQIKKRNGPRPTRTPKRVHPSTTVKKSINTSSNHKIRKPTFEDDKTDIVSAEISIESDSIQSLAENVENLSIKGNLQPSNNVSSVNTIQSKAKKKQSTNIRITKSERIFIKNHSFEDILVKPVENGSGCYVFYSTWSKKKSVTKLMPMFDYDGFSAEDSTENAKREASIHTSLYRSGCKKYGMDECPITPIWSVVEIEYDDNKEDQQEYLALVMPRYETNLMEYVRKHGPLSCDDAKKLLNIGVRFLALLEEQKIVHHDIKPENIFVQVDSKNQISNFVFGDFGCSVYAEETFPFGPITGTLTMWDDEALGKAFGDENGFSAQNDLFGILQSLTDAILGESLIETIMVQKNPAWENLEWEDYTNIIRECRKEINKSYLEKCLKKVKFNDLDLQKIVYELIKPRENRITLDYLKKNILND